MLNGVVGTDSAIHPVGGAEIAGNNKGWALTVTPIPGFATIKQASVMIDQAAKQGAMGTVLTVSATTKQLYLTSLAVSVANTDDADRGVYIGWATAATASQTSAARVLCYNSSSCDRVIVFNPPLSASAANRNLYAFVGDATTASTIATASSMLATIDVTGFEV